jgi:hypothetical protein
VTNRESDSCRQAWLRDFVGARSGRLCLWARSFGRKSPKRENIIASSARVATADRPDSADRTGPGLGDDLAGVRFRVLAEDGGIAKPGGSSELVSPTLHFEVRVEG